MMSEFVWMYSTAPNPEIVRNIAHVLIREGLAACVNILPGGESVYMWDGVIQHENETIMVIKTMMVHKEVVIDRIAELHPYECPAILVMPVLDGFMPWLSWARGQCAQV